MKLLPPLEPVRAELASTEATTNPKARIRIANAPPGYPNGISMKHAERWVKQRKAEFVVGVLLLKPMFRQVLIRSMNPAQQVEGAGYDAIRRTMTSTEKRNLPLAALPVRPTRRRTSDYLGLLRWR